MPACPLEPDSPCVSRLHPSPNIEPRRGGATPDTLILHYTGFGDVDKAIAWLATPESRVSCHYVVDVDGAVTQMVAEADRAWHAGESVWHGETDMNSRSVGIEIHNPGHDRGYPEFPPAQMDAVIALSHDIIARHAITPPRVLAHSDVAPHRKIDPGEKFDWKLLFDAGIGHWVPPAPLTPPGDRALNDPDEIRALQRNLAAYGYGCPVSGAVDRRTEFVIAAFQRHFRPARVDGRPDASTRDTLNRLLSALATPPPAVV